MQVKMLGTNALLISDIAVKDIKLVKKYKPEMLILKDEKDNELFAVNFSKTSGTSGKYGITFDENVNGKAATSVNCDPAISVEKRKDALVDFMMDFIQPLELLTKQLTDAAKDIRAFKDDVAKQIEVINLTESDEGDEDND